MNSLQETRTVLVVDDDVYTAHQLCEFLNEQGFQTFQANGPEEALKIVKTHTINAAVLDVMMPPGSFLELISTRGGFRTGQVLARKLREQFPTMKIVGYSVYRDEELRDWFLQQRGMRFLTKPARPSTVLDELRDLLFGERRLPRIFIVHGRDTDTVKEVKYLLRDRLMLGEPIILAEQPSTGRTIIEKFEDYAAIIDLAIVLLTPDDMVYGTDSNTPAPRARQNVIFELGYFSGYLGRKSGKLIVLVKGPLELPSDVHGLVYIDIGHGVEAKAEELRRELRAWIEG
jgi:CheY-like chemotaxis protein